MNPNLQPLDLFLGLMRMPELPLMFRIDAARQALPYCQTKPRPAPLTPPPNGKNDESGPRVKVRPKTGPGQDDDGGGLDADWLGVGRNSPANSTVDVQHWIEAVARAAGLPADEDGPAQVAAANGRKTPDDAAAAKLNHVRPITFLRALMRCPDTPMHLRLQVASILAPYLHAKPLPAPPGEQTFEIEDRYGFQVDPVFAKWLWGYNERLRANCRTPSVPKRGTATNEPR